MGPGEELEAGGGRAVLKMHIYIYTHTSYVEYFCFLEMGVKLLGVCISISIEWSFIKREVYSTDDTESKEKSDRRGGGKREERWDISRVVSSLPLSL